MTFVHQQLLRELTPVNITDIYESGRQDNEVGGLLERMQEYPKLVILFTIPRYAVFCAVHFFRANLNFAEHLVLNSYSAAGEIVVMLLFSITMIFVHDLGALASVNVVFSFLTVGYSTWFYFQFFSAYNYPRRGRLFFRSLLAAMALNIVKPALLNATS